MPPIIDPTTKFGDRFLIQSESGLGGMGTIYRATDAHSGQEVALKVLHDKSTAAAERFNKEAAALAALQHPAIVRYVDHGVTPQGEHYLAMEWLEGETLEERLSRGPLGIIETARLGQRVFEALAVAHAHGIVHRDIKPANLFLPGGDLGQLKVLDFGIARRLFDTRRMTMTNSALGTPMYMSPEQVRGAKSVDARSDVFSMGCLLFECLTGAPPFTADTPMAVLAKICLDDTPDLAEARPDLPAPLVLLIDRLLTKDPDQRPGDAAALVLELGTIIHALAYLGIGASDSPSRSRIPVLRLATDEQRVVSAIIVSRVRAGRAGPLSEVNARGALGTWDIPGTLSLEGSVNIFDEATFTELAKAMEPFGARLDRFLGGALVVTLVGQGTTTDRAALAGRCALKLKSMLPKACLAISTGRAVVDARLPIGQVIEEACRLVEGEGPGSIRLDEATAGLMESRFELGTQDDNKYLLFEKGLKEAPRTLLGKEMPCVGRDRELGTLEALYDECIGEPVARAVLVTAPAGGGKSRIRHEILDRIQSRGEPFELLIGRGDSIRAGAPFAMLGPALRSAAGISGTESLEIQQKRLASHVGKSVKADMRQRVAAFLGEIAGVPFPDENLPALRAARQDPRLMADQTLAAWLDWVEAVCVVRPVVLVLEDLHWGDVPSVQLIDAALRTLSDKPLLIFALARPEVDTKFPNLWVERDLQRIALPPLTAKSCQKLMKHVLGDAADSAAWMIERADGNPFFLEELLRATASGADMADGRAVPDTVIGMVQARFDTLGKDAKRVLRAASVFGQTFRASGIRALVGDEDKSLDQWLDILTTREVVFPRGSGPAREFAFRHALLHDAAYEMLTPQDRTLCHHRAGEWLEAEGEREAIVLVEHFERGGDLLRAAQHCRPAAVQALDANDLGAAIDRVERGVRNGASGETLGALRVTEAQARFWRGEYVECERAARDASTHAQPLDTFHAHAELVAALGKQAKFSQIEIELQRLREPPRNPAECDAWCVVLIQAAGYLASSGHHDVTEQILADVETRMAQSATIRASVLNVQAQLALLAGKQATAVHAYQSALAIYEAQGNLRAATEMLGNLGMALGDMGVLEEAESYLQNALSASERMNLHYVSACNLVNLTLVQAHLGSFVQARQTGDRARRLARGQGDHRMEGGAELYLAAAEFLSGNAAQSQSHASAALTILADVPPMAAVARAALARALLQRGCPVEALYIAQDAYALFTTYGKIEDGEALIRLVFAECLLANGDERRAHDVLDEAARRLMERAAAIQQADWRATFLTRLPDNARTLKLARQLGLVSAGL